MIEAVLVRGIQRAQRLRYVSKAWNVAVGRAIIESGVLDNEVNQLSSVHWPYHFAYKALHDKTYVPGGIASTHFGICRMVAEQVTNYKGLDANTDAYTVALKSTLNSSCVMIQICRAEWTTDPLV
ncbi:hypothetical protein PG990_015333 [Apiospora arundinis]